MTKIKLCGLTRPCDIDWANELLPDYIGFVFAQKSKRFITPDTARTLRACLDGRITPVGVFADADIDFIAALTKDCTIGAVQLHGSEDEAYIGALRDKTDCPVIKAFHIKDEGDIAAAAASTADFVMLDSGGGTGKTFDHTLLKGISRDYFLAGGLTPKNVHEAVQMLLPYAVDASSSLETDGVKDREKMAAFVRAVRRRKEEAK